MAELSRVQILKNPEIIGVGTTGSKIRLQDGNETGYVDIKSPNTVGTGYTVTLPPTLGVSGKVLQLIDDSGNTDWGTSISGVGINTEGGVVGTGATILDFRGSGISTTTVSAGIATIYIEGGTIQGTQGTQGLSNKVPNIIFIFTTYSFVVVNRNFFSKLLDCFNIFTISKEYIRTFNG